MWTCLQHICQDMRLFIIHQALWYKSTTLNPAGNGVCTKDVFMKVTPGIALRVPFGSKLLIVRRFRSCHVVAMGENFSFCEFLTAAQCYWATAATKYHREVTNRRTIKLLLGRRDGKVELTLT